MAAKMDLIVAGPDRHVLAAAVRTNKGGAAPTVADLVGTGLQIRDPTSGAVQVTVPAEELVLAEVDLRDDVLLTARRFALVENLPEEGTQEHGSPVVLNGLTIVVNLPAAAPEGGGTVWVLIEGGPQAIVHRVAVAESDSSASETLQLPTGSYTSLVLAPGVRAAVVKSTVP